MEAGLFPIAQLLFEPFDHFDVFVRVVFRQVFEDHVVEFFGDLLIFFKGKSLFKQRDDQISHSFKALAAGVCIFADRPAHFAARDLVATLPLFGRIEEMFGCFLTFFLVGF